MIKISRDTFEYIKHGTQILATDKEYTALGSFQGFFAKMISLEPAYNLEAAVNVDDMNVEKLTQFIKDKGEKSRYCRLGEHFDFYILPSKK